MVHAMTMLVIKKKLFLYGLGGYELVKLGFSCDGDVKYTLLFSLFR